MNSEHKAHVRLNDGGGPRYLGAECSCGWKRGSPGSSRASCESLIRRHLAWVELGSRLMDEEYPGSGTTRKKPSRSAVVAYRGQP